MLKLDELLFGHSWNQTCNLLVMNPKCCLLIHSSRFKPNVAPN